MSINALRFQRLIDLNVAYDRGDRATIRRLLPPDAARAFVRQMRDSKLVYAALTDAILNMQEPSQAGVR